MKTNMRATAGTLYVVATPIGHLSDISQRAIETLQLVDLILAEDTRHSLKLFQALGVKKPLISFHAHNENDRSKEIIERLMNGEQIALVSDAGTPLISDPGFTLVSAARAAGIRVCPIPGCCALIAALSVAGVPSDVFTFIGFLPAKSNARRQTLEKYQGYGHTIMAYESTHRVLAAARDIADVYGETYTWVLAKELTKTFETIISATSAQIIQWLAVESHIKGEFVLILPAHSVGDAMMDTRLQDESLLKELLPHLPLKQAVSLAARLLNRPKNALYDLALKLIS